MLSEIQLVSSFNHWIASSFELTAVAIFLARWLIFAFILVGALLLSSGRKTDRHAVSEAIWSVFLVLGITAIVAKLIGRPRPFLVPLTPYVLHPILALVPPPYNTSFPSGHTGTAFAMAVAFFHANRRLGIAGFVLAALIATGRIAVGVHYPTDIVGGIIVGLASFGIVRFCHRQVRRTDLTESIKSHKHV